MKRLEMVGAPLHEAVEGERKGGSGYHDDDGAGPAFCLLHVLRRRDVQGELLLPAAASAAAVPPQQRAQSLQQHHAGRAAHAWTRASASLPHCNPTCRAAAVW